MRYRLTLCSVCLLVVSSAAYSQQISPNPNPVGNTITVVTGSNDADPFTNDGQNYIANDGTLWNAGTLNNRDRLTNNGTLDNRDTLNNGGTIYNADTLNNYGTLTNDGMLSAPNRGRLPPRLSSHVTGAPHSLGGAADIAACSTIDQALDRQPFATMSRMAIS